MCRPRFGKTVDYPRDWSQNGFYAIVFPLPDGTSDSVAPLWSVGICMYYLQPWVILIQVAETHSLGNSV